jgi:hypothetical protein
MSYRRKSHFVVPGQVQQSSIIRLPKLEKDSVSTFSVSGVVIKVCLADMFEPTPDLSPTDNKVVMVVNSPDGALNTIWLRLNGEKGDVQKEIEYTQRVASNIPSIKNAIYFSYPREVTQWNEVFHNVAEIIEDNELENTILFVPTFGTNNRISYHDAGLGIYSGLTCAIEEPDSKLAKLKEVRIVTPYADDQETSSCRTLRHIFNMVEFHNNNNTESGKGIMCMVCMSNPCNTVLPCGHMLCIFCERKLKTELAYGDPKCMFCKQVYDQCFNCVTPSKVAFECCKPPDEEMPPQDDHGEQADQVDHTGSAFPKTDITYIPCGHTGVRCVNCENDSVTVCAICSTVIERKMKVFY